MNEEYNLIRFCGCNEPHRVFSTDNIGEFAKVAMTYSKLSELGEIRLEVKRDGKYVSFDELERHRKLVESRIEELLIKIQ